MAEENEQGTHLDVPDFLQYSHDHVWVDESVTPAVLGITEFAANKMGDIVFVDIYTKQSTENALETWHIRTGRTASSGRPSVCLRRHSHR